MLFFVVSLAGASCTPEGGKGEDTGRDSGLDSGDTDTRPDTGIESDSDAETGNDSDSDSDTGGDSADSGLDSGGPADADGDGYAADDDCDDGDGSRWLPYDEVVDDLRAGFTSFCDGYCARGISGTLDPSAVTDAAVGALTCLSHVGGSLYIDGNMSLSSLDGLGALEDIDGDFFVATSGLRDLSGLTALVHVGDFIDLELNDGLLSLTGLERVTSVGTDLIVYGNPGLGSLEGLDGLTEVGGVLMVQANGGLADLTGLEALERVGDNLLLRENDALTSLSALRSLSTVAGDLDISSNPLLCATMRSTRCWRASRASLARLRALGMRGGCL